MRPTGAPTERMEGAQGLTAQAAMDLLDSGDEPAVAMNDDLVVGLGPGDTGLGDGMAWLSTGNTGSLVAAAGSRSSSMRPWPSITTVQTRAWRA